METVTRLTQPPAGGGRGGGGGGFGGGQGPIAKPGDYLVTVRVGDATAKTVLRVERASGEGTNAGVQGDDDDAPPQAIRPRIF